MGTKCPRSSSNWIDGVITHPNRSCTKRRRRRRGRSLGEKVTGWGFVTLFEALVQATPKPTSSAAVERGALKSTFRRHVKVTVPDLEVISP